MYSDRISPAQVNFIRSLVGERLVTIGVESVDAFVATANLNALDKGDASKLIGRLKAMAPDPDPHMPDVVRNATRKGTGNRPGPCSGCGHLVEAGTGYYWMTTSGKWQVHHKVGECGAEDAPMPVRHDVTEGFYKLTNGDVVQVYLTKNKRLAAKVMTSHGAFEYQTGAVRLAEMGERMTPEDVANEQCVRRFGAPIGSAELLERAKAHSVESGCCMFCMRVLDDPRSNPAAGGVGYGPKCAQNYGLPWG